MLALQALGFQRVFRDEFEGRYDFLREVRPGDLVFSYASGLRGAGFATSVPQHILDACYSRILSEGLCQGEFLGIRYIFSGARSDSNK